MSKKTALIMGAGPAGLTAAYELLATTDILPLVIEQSEHLGGLSKTIDYKGNKIDIGGHRFYSKSDRVMQWWLTILPLYLDENQKKNSQNISYQAQSRQLPVAASIVENTDKVMLLRKRKSRIFFRKKLFDYPLRFNFSTLQKLGFFFSLSVLASYIRSSLFFTKEEKTLEDFLIKRFGKKLYLTFFKDYTEKVWGIECKKIDASWGAQRIKGLSIRKAMAHAFAPAGKTRKTETSLIEQFLYPKFGPGQMWQEVGQRITEKGGKIEKKIKVIGLTYSNSKITSAILLDLTSGKEKEVFADYFISTIPVKELIKGLGKAVPADVRTIAEGLVYRDFITVGLLLKKIKNKSGEPLEDTWLYVQEKGLKMGRIQFFNNWSPFLVEDPSTVWVGLEYFCNEGDALWSKSENEMRSFAIQEFTRLGFIEDTDVLDSVVIKEAKAYPAYTGSYKDFERIRSFTDPITNLFLIGRNGMHRYNNQDHSMLTAMIAVENIKNGLVEKEGIWKVNAEEDYLEENE